MSEYSCVKVLNGPDVDRGVGRCFDTVGSTGGHEATFTVVAGSERVRFRLRTLNVVSSRSAAETCGVTNGTATVTVPASAIARQVAVFVRSAAAPPVVGVEPA